MTRKAICSRCNKWFYNHNGMMIYLPPEYDDSMCPKCNEEIDMEIKGVVDTDRDWSKKRCFERIYERR